ncbi:hypothetical protein COCSUDRAFT_55107 [Coccomyxa subellipsoidea C-169]|uniref:Uncharacterized protein n=1 Tax=Coccomyxa subellipsoidea (strain C-169) TaxID=574566 RepID=I0Z8W6_COCSC|nr:hypothetical protein COCSUDRAFT_55107 [Coccomyxa subellipsoidea C-169]EIE27085.1 hypothetical protein COCSUDRAFT_55107 [Coccomyxa subellipsoidea C-169]|eukprot:XP_005651629.1 hypothetical protein COCSUDRAFT_55107 [Coccomyxa subellipsoidea C-169]
MSMDTRRNAVWRQRRHVLQEIIPDSFWTALSRFDNGTWTAYTPGFAYEAACREGTQRAAFAEAERRIARTVRSMYEVGHRLPVACYSLEAAQQEEQRNREAYEALEDRLRAADAASASAQAAAGPKVVERQWLRVHVDLSLADSLTDDENPLVRRAVEPFVVTYDNGEEEEEDDLDSEEERGAEMAVDDDTPWVEPPLVGSDGDPFSAGEPGTSTRGAEIDSLRPFRAMLESRAQLVAAGVRDARAGGNGPDGVLHEADRILARAAEGLSGSARSLPNRPIPRRYEPYGIEPLMAGTPRVRYSPRLRPAEPAASWKQGEASFR